MFAGLPEIPCRTFDVLSGELVQVPLAQWVSGGYYKTHSLVLHGDAGVGKTPLAMSMCSEIGDILQCDFPWKPCYIKVGTVEALWGT